MKVEDLTIGSWVKVNDIEHTHPLQVTEIYRKSGIWYTTLYWDGMPDDAMPESIEADIDKILPVPLTPEILEKNGWIKDGYFYKSKDCGYVQLGELFEHASFDASKYGVNVRVQTLPSGLRYVHQLQQALRLCGIKKEIEL